MKTKYITLFLAVVALALAGALLLTGQESDITGKILGGERPALAAIDFRGAGEAQQFMDTFNASLWNELSGSGVIKMVPKSVYPLEVPQQASDFKPPSPDGRRTGPWLTDWTDPKVGANFLAFGYAAVQNGQLVLRGHLYNVGQPDLATAAVSGFGNPKLYFGSIDEAGAKKVAREYAADILRQLGGTSLADTKIYFVSDRTGNKEIWVMDYDGSNQRQLTNYKSITEFLAVSADGRMFACTTNASGRWQIRIHSTETGNRLTFVNPVSSIVATPEFTPDGKQLLFSTKLEDSGYTNLFAANIDGSNLRRITAVRAVEVSPRVNPKTGNDVLFISGRSGTQQLWRMNINGGDLERLTDGTGDVSNPSWSPDGLHIAFAWTRGYDPGNFNIFIMDVGDKSFVQLTHGAGRNENPWWAPDGVHLVYSSKRGNSTQIYTMLADGTHVQQLTTQGNNLQPVWAKGIN
jgi:TolB protein